MTAHFKQLLTYASKSQPLTLYLDSVDQLTGTQDSSKVAWIPTRLPPYCKIILSCACEEANPEVSQEYYLLRRMIDSPENFIEVTALGEELAMEVIKMWMQTACRDLSNFQWRLVSNAIAKCSLPIFVKLVFAEICRWKSYTKPQDTHLASNVMDSIMMLFERCLDLITVEWGEFGLFSCFELLLQFVSSTSPQKTLKVAIKSLNIA